MPCKPRMRGCAAGCLHRQLVENYRDARDAWETRLEAETSMYATEMAEWTADNPGPTFKAWLVGNTGPRPGQPA